MLVMKANRLVVAFAVLALSPLAASAAIIFDNVVITGALAAGGSWNTTPDAIEFDFPSAEVGDNLAVRSGTISLTFLVTSEIPLTADIIELAAPAGLFGSGRIVFSEVIEVLNGDGPEIIGSYSVVLDANSPLPHTDTLFFSKPATEFKVKKSVTLVAPETSVFDYASLASVRQQFIPEPAGALLLLLGAPLLRRR